jgi:hypothetical protein
VFAAVATVEPVVATPARERRTPHHGHSVRLARGGAASDLGAARRRVLGGVARHGGGTREDRGGERVSVHRGLVVARCERENPDERGYRGVSVAESAAETRQAIGEAEGRADFGAGGLASGGVGTHARTIVSNGTSVNRN